MRVLLATIILSLSACQTVSEAVTTSKMPQSLSEIVGDWDVIRFDNHYPVRLDYDGRRNAYINVTDKGYVAFRMGCNFTAIKGSLDSSSRLIRDPKSGGGATVMGCASPEREARERAFFEMMYDNPTVEIISDGRLRYSTTQHEVILEDSDTRRFENAPESIEEISGQWTVQMVHGRIGWGAYNATQTLSVSAQKIQYGDCIPALREPVINNQAFLKGKRDKENSSAYTDTCSKLTEAEEVILNTLVNGPSVEWTEIGDLVISIKDKYQILLTKS